MLVIPTNWGTRDWKAALQKDLGVYIVSKLNVSQLCVLAAKRTNCVSGCNKHSIASQLREVTVPLYITVVWPHRKYCVQFWAPPRNKGSKL